MRMFVALVPPESVLEDLEEFLGPRREAGRELRWTSADQWHLTLAFMADVAPRHLDDLVERLGRAASRRTPFELALAGGGAFPNPGRAKVLYAGVATDDESLRAAVADLEAAGTSRKEAIVQVAKEAGVPKRHVYALVHTS